MCVCVDQYLGDQPRGKACVGFVSVSPGLPHKQQQWRLKRAPPSRCSSSCPQQRAQQQGTVGAGARATRTLPACAHPGTTGRNAPTPPPASPPSAACRCPSHCLCFKILMAETHQAVRDPEPQGVPLLAAYHEGVLSHVFVVSCSGWAVGGGRQRTPGFIYGWIRLPTCP